VYIALFNHATYQDQFDGFLGKALQVAASKGPVQEDFE